jgi:hypothetical protein
MIQLDWSLSNSNEIAYCHGRRFVDKPLDESRKIGKVAKIAHNRLSLALLFSSEQIGLSSPADFAKLYRMLRIFVPQEVDVSPLRSNAGDPPAAYVEQDSRADLLRPWRAA